MLKPSRSGPNMPSGPSRPNDSPNQKKSTSHSASPNAKRMLSPAREKRLRRIVASSNKIKAPSPSRHVALASRDLICACRCDHPALPLIADCNEVCSAVCRRARLCGDCDDEATPVRKPSRRAGGGGTESGRAGRGGANALAAAARGFTAGGPERLGRCLAMSGMGPVSIRAAAREPRFLLGVLDHLAADEPLLLAFAAENAIDPGEVIEARDTMAGRRWERDTP